MNADRGHPAFSVSAPRWLAVSALMLAAACRGAPHATDDATPNRELVACDVLIVGGSFGGCAAAIGAAGGDVWMVEDGDWIGGQVTSQGVSALDEHKYVETAGRTREYARFRDGVRARSGGKNNPGGGWVSRLCFEPKVGLAQLESMTRDAGTHVLLDARPIEAVVEDQRVVSVTFRREDGSEVEFAPRLVLDATDTGELLPLAGVAYRLGADARADTEEPHAAERTDARCQQSFTYTFAVEFRAGESHVEPAAEPHAEPEPPGYAEMRDRQPYSLTLTAAGGKPMKFGFFAHEPGSSGPFWTYRRITPTVAMINWPGNDYRGRPLIAPDLDAIDPIACAEAKRLSLGFLHWLQTECPRDDGGRGYPELLLRPDVMGTDDGLSKRPYVREGRRLVARGTVREQDLTGGSGARARAFEDSVGLGWYAIDVHASACDERDGGGLGLATKPFQIPLSTLIPRDVRNVIAAGKCLGVTHVTNGAYRLHPIEWNTGESAGRLAAYCLEHRVDPRDVLERVELRREFQVRLLRAGVPIFWFTDLKEGTDEWISAQALAAWGEVPVDEAVLEFGGAAEKREAVRSRLHALERSGWLEHGADSRAR